MKERVLTSAQFYTRRKTRLVRPRPGYTLDCIPTSTKQQQRQVERLDKLDALCVTAHGEIERAYTIARERIGPALEHNRTGLIPVNDAANDLSAWCQQNPSLCRVC